MTKICYKGLLLTAKASTWHAQRTGSSEMEQMMKQMGRCLRLIASFQQWLHGYENFLYIIPLLTLLIHCAYLVYSRFRIFQGLDPAMMKQMGSLLSGFVKQTSDPTKNTSKAWTPSPCRTGCNPSYSRHTVVIQSSYCIQYSFSIVSLHYT